MVISHLTQFDLASCIRVCKAWNKMSYPFLWKHICDPPPRYSGGDSDSGSDNDTDNDKMSYDHHLANGVRACASSGALKRNGHLVESIRIETDNVSLGGFLMDCPPTFPRLTSLWIDGVDDDDDDDLVQLLDRCSAGLREFSFSPRLVDNKWRHYEIGDRSVEALLKHAATLEVVRVQGDYVCGWERIDRLLCSLPKLKEIDFEFNCLTNRGGWLEAGKVVDSDWVCLDLEVFGCTIRGIPRPDIARTLTANDQIIPSKLRNGTSQESLGLQRRMYTKLARFTKLRELRLSSLVDECSDEYRNINKKYVWQYDCLSMTLESGLDALKDLQDLRVVALWYLENGISNAEETEWVQRNWPQVEIRFEKFYRRRRR